MLPVSEKTLDYAEGVTEKLVEAGVRVVLDDDNQKIGYKIREAQQVDRVPYMLVLGAKEAEAGNISVRVRKGDCRDPQPQPVSRHCKTKSAALPARESGAFLHTKL